MLFATLLLLSSCTKYDFDNQEGNQIDMSALNVGLEVEEYLNTHLELINDFSYTIAMEEDIEAFESKLNSTISKQNLSDSFKIANFEKYEELTNLFMDIQYNLQSYVETHRVEFSEIELTNFLEAKMNSKDEVDFLKSDKCYDQWVRADRRCQRAYWLSLGGSIVGGLFTGGVGTLVGLSVTLANGILCVNDAGEDLRNCRAETVL